MTASLSYAACMRSTPVFVAATYLIAILSVLMPSAAAAPDCSGTVDVNCGDGCAVATGRSAADATDLGRCCTLYLDIQDLTCAVFDPVFDPCPPCGV
jgi:hypothetical protein